MIPYLPKTFELGETPRFDDLPILDDSGNQWHIYQMSALGNRFLIVDENTHPFEPTSEQIIDLADKSPEWDQLLTDKVVSRTQITTRVWNRDGSRAENCGNGVRCLAALQMFRTQKQDEADRQMEFSISIGNSPLTGIRCSIETIKNSRSQAVISRIEPAAMTHEKLSESALAHPLIHEKIQGVQSAAEVSYGNPHLVLFLDDSTSPLQEAQQKGKKLEAELSKSDIPFYRHGVNISFAQIRTDEAAIKELGSKAKARIDLQVWERGAGLTRSCGSGAAATWHAAFKQKLVEDEYASWEDPINIFNAFHIALKPIRLKVDVRDFFDREWDINAFRAVSTMQMGYHLIGNSQIERAGTLTL